MATKKTPDKSEPMDATAREKLVGETPTNHLRTCHAIKQLVAEVADLFPETPVEYSAYDGRNTALGVTFDLTVHNAEEATLLGQLIGLVESDERVEEVTILDDAAYVGFKSSPRLQDSRASFGIGDAFDVLVDDDESNWVEAPFDHPFRIEGSW